MAESVRESLEAALAGAAGDDGEGAGTIAPIAEAQAPAEAVAAPEAKTPEPTGDKPTAAPERDESGRFKPKDTPAAEGAQAAQPPADKPTTETAKPAEAGPQTEATRIPPSLPAAVKAQWSDLKPEVQQAFQKLEDTVQTSKAEWGKKGERLNRFDEIIGPQLDRFRSAGLDEFSGLQTLLAAQAMLDRNPIDGILQIARSYSIHPQQLAQQLAQMTGAPRTAEGQQAPTAQPDFAAALQPVLAPVLQQVQTLAQRFDQQAQASESAKIAEAQAMVAEFSAANMYFENVRHDVARRLADKSASTLAEAYEQATWASPEIRPLLLAEQAKQQQAAQAARTEEDARRKKADQARAASGSVTGAPTPGAQALTQAPPGSIRDSLKSALQEARAQV